MPPASATNPANCITSPLEKLRNAVIINTITITISAVIITKEQVLKNRSHYIHSQAKCVNDAVKCAYSGFNKAVFNF